MKVAGEKLQGSALERAPLEVSVNCEPEPAVALRGSHAAIRPGYHLNKRHWNTITLDGNLSDHRVRDIIEDSKVLVVSARARAPRAPPRPPAAVGRPGGPDGTISGNRVG